MNIKMIKKSQMFKSYVELCKALDIKPEPNGSNSRKSQIKEMEKYFSFTTNRRMIIITDVYNKERVKMDKRTRGNNTIHAENVEYMLISLLSKFDIVRDARIGLSKNFIFSYTGLSNENYKLAKTNRLKFSQLIDMPIQEINECFDYSSNRMLQTVQSALNRMKKKALITWGYGYNLILKDETDNDSYMIVADAALEKDILNIERKVLQEFGCDTKRQVFLCSNWSEFKKSVEEELRKEYPNLKYYYDSICINFNKDDILRELERIESSGINKLEVKNNVNKNFSKSLDGTITRKHKKYKDAMVLSTTYSNYYASSDYVSNQKEIKNTIINKDNKVIDFSLSLNKDVKEKIEKRKNEFNKKYRVTSDQLLFDLGDIPF